MSVTVVSSLYGGWYGRFVKRWEHGITQLNRKPDRVIVAGDDKYPILNSTSHESQCDWRHPQAYYLDRAIRLAHTEWVWIVDIDDIALPDGLAGLEDVKADVWQMGFERSDGETYVPPQMGNREYLDSDRNVFVGGSAFRLDAYLGCGGFADVAYQDWSLWRRLAASGASFESSGRTHFRYEMHPHRRGETELRYESRPEHIAEMMEVELAVA